MQQKGGEISNPLFNPGIVTSFDRIVYRLTLLGIVTDYTVNYSLPEWLQHQLTTAPLSDDEVRKKLLRYVGRYRKTDALPEFAAKFDVAPGDAFIERAIHVLCDFVYDEIESQRREAMWNIRDMLRTAQDGEHLRQLLGRYFDSSVYRPLIYGLLTDDPAAKSWQEISKTVQNEAEASQLLGQSRRALESAPDSPELRLLSGLAQAASDIPDASQSAESVILGIAGKFRSHPEAARTTALAVVIELQEIAPAQFDDVIEHAVIRQDFSVPGSIEAAELIATAALPRVTARDARERCAIAVARRITRVRPDPLHDTRMNAREVVSELSTAQEDAFDSAVREILRSLMADPTQSNACREFASSAFRTVSDPALKQALAAPLLQDLRRNVQHIV